MQGKALSKKFRVFLPVAFSKTMYVNICDCRELWEESAKRDDGGVMCGVGPAFVYFYNYRSEHVCW